jgi:hypothetical protein
MTLDRVQGTIRRRILVNFRVDPEVMRRTLPAPFEPKLANGHAIAGICLIRLENERPSWLPLAIGASSENAAHRVAVYRRDAHGRQEESVYIARRDSDSALNRWAGGRLFPGEHGPARFVVDDDHTTVRLDMRAADGLQVGLRAHAASSLPARSAFASLEEASAFFRGGALGYSVTRARSRLDALYLDTNDWRVAPLQVDWVQTTYFENVTRFPPGSVELDCALIMRDVPHVWRRKADLVLGQAGADWV